MTIPQDLFYSRNHEWLRVDGDLATLGITEYAASALGDVVFVGLPKVGENLAAGKVCGEIESTKSVSDLYSPAAGQVIEINEALTDAPESINSDPYGAGWLFRLRPTGELDLLDAAAYAELIDKEG